MTKDQLIQSATTAYHAQLKREHEFRQAVRAGRIQLEPQSRVSVEQLHTSR